MAGDEFIALITVQSKVPLAVRKSQEFPGGFAAVSARFLTEADLLGKNAEELKLMRNEIFARHGYRFSSQRLQEYFSKYYSRHESSSADVYSMLTEIERANVKFIKEYELKR